MLQQIATGKSEVATFALEPSLGSVDKARPTDEFAAMLKHQQTGSRRKDEHKPNAPQASPQRKALSPDPKEAAPIKVSEQLAKGPGQERPITAKQSEQHVKPEQQTRPITNKGGSESEASVASVIDTDNDPVLDPVHDSVLDPVNEQLDATQVESSEEPFFAQKELTITTEEAGQWLDLISMLVSKSSLNSAHEQINSEQNLAPDDELLMQQLIAQQFDVSGNSASIDESSLLEKLAELMENLLQGGSGDDQGFAQLPDHLQAQLLGDPQIRDTFSQLLALNKLSDAGENTPQDASDTLLNDPEDIAIAEQLMADSLPLADQQLLMALISEAISTLNLSQTEQLLEQRLEQPPEPQVSDVTELGELLSTLPTAQLNAELLSPEALAILPVESSLRQIIQLPKDQLDTALSYLAHKLTANDTPVGLIQAEAKAEQVASLSMDKLLGKADPVADFIGALKSGIAEVKAQLSQGREPGIDLKALVNEALKVTAETVNLPLSKQPEQLDLALKAFNQTLDFAQQLGSTLNQIAEQNASASSYRELGQLQGEQVKASQLHTNQLDKALNLAKPEAHQQLVEKVRWMVNHNQLVADIRLDPAELGSMQVKVSLAGESANVSFVVNSAQAKEAIDNAALKLRDMLAEKGIELGQSSVEQEQQQDTQGQDSSTPGNGQLGGPDDELANEQVLQQPVVNGALGGIDYFV